MAGYPSDTRAIQVRVLCLQPTHLSRTFIPSYQNDGTNVQHTFSRITYSMILCAGNDRRNTVFFDVACVG
jgi:hypothetical protein